MVQTVQQRVLEHLLLQPVQLVLLQAGRTPLKYSHFLFQQVLQDLRAQTAQQDQRGPQVQQVLTVQMVQRQGSALRPLQQDLLA